MVYSLKSTRRRCTIRTACRTAGSVHGLTAKKTYLGTQPFKSTVFGDKAYNSGLSENELLAFEDLLLITWLYKLSLHSYEFLLIFYSHF